MGAFKTQNYAVILMTYNKLKALNFGGERGGFMLQRLSSYPKDRNR
jgi:hypothetical protein